MAKRDVFFFFVVFIVGSILRLIWPADMEWKIDEIWMYEKAMAMVHANDFRWIGMPSSSGFANPGFSVWFFAAIGFFINDPVGMVIWVQWFNVIAILAFFWFGYRYLKDNRERHSFDKTAWQWGMAFWVASPVPIMLSRKIWTQSVLPPIAFLVFLCHWFRKRKTAAFFWGMTGAIIGQIHMAGFFFAFGLVAYSLYQDIVKKQFDFRSWLWWLFGSVLASLPMLPWLEYLLNRDQPSNYLFWEIFTFKFFTQWNGAAWGINLKEYLGDFFFSDFIKEPLVGGFPTYIVALAHIYLVGVALKALLQWAWGAIKKRDRFLLNLKSKESKIYPYLMSLGIISGVAFTISGFSVHAHYMVPYYAFIFFWGAYFFVTQPKYLYGIVVAQLIISACLILMVHRKGGIENADYGKAYYLQNYQEPCSLRGCKTEK